AEQDLEHEQHVMTAIRNAVSDDAATFWHMPVAGYWAWNPWGARCGARHSAQGAGGIGYAVAPAVRRSTRSGPRRLGTPRRGSAMYPIAERAAAKQHNVPVTWLSIDDRGYGILREYMEANFGEATATELARPDFIALVESFGIAAMSSDADGLEAALGESWTADGPNVAVLDTTLAMWHPTHLDHADQN